MNRKVCYGRFVVPAYFYHFHARPQVRSGFHNATRTTVALVAGDCMYLPAYWYMPSRAVLSFCTIIYCYSSGFHIQKQQDKV